MDTVTFLNNYSNLFIRFSWIMLLQSSVLILILLGLDVLLRQKVRAVFRYCLWMLVLIKLVLPVGLALPCSPAYYASSLLPEKVVDSPQVLPEIAAPNPVITPADDSIPHQTVLKTPDESVAAAETTAIEPPTVSESAPIQQPPVSLSWQTFLSLGWLIAVLVMLGLLIQRIFFVNSLIRQSKPADETLLSQLKRCFSKMGLRRHVDLRISPNATSPSVCGLIRPVILIPDNLTDQLNTGQMDAILMHELAHIKRGDLWVNLVQALLQIIYFYNPLLWMANAVIRRIREQAVDEMVLVAMDDRAEEYPQTLLNVSKLVWSKPMLSLRLIGVVESKSALTGRIKHILSRPFPKSAKIGLVGFVAVSVFAATLLPMANRPKQDNASGIISPAKVQWLELTQTEDSASFHVRFDRQANQRLLVYYYHARFIQEDDGGIERKSGVGGPSRSNFDNGKVDIIGKIYRQGSIWNFEYAIHDPARKKKTIENAKGTFGPTPEGTTRLIFFKDLNEITSSPNRLFELQVLRDDAIIQRYGFIGEINPNEDLGDNGAIQSRKDYVKNLWKMEESPSSELKMSNYNSHISNNTNQKIRMDFILAEPVVGRNVDAETFTQIKDLLGHEYFSDNRGPGTVESVFNRYAHRAPEEKYEKLVEFLVSRGYLRIISKPSFTLYDKQSSTITISGDKERAIPDLSMTVQPEIKIDPDIKNRQVVLLHTTFISQHSEAFKQDKSIETQNRVTHNAIASLIDLNGTYSSLPPVEVKSERQGQMPLLTMVKIAFVTEAKTPNADLQTNNYTATLPNGVTVELLGVAEYPSDGKQWWSPQGAVMSKSPYATTANKTIHHKDGYRNYEFALRLQPEDASYSWIVQGSSFGSDTGSPKDQNGQTLYKLKSYQAGLPDHQQATDIRIGATAAPWKTVATVKSSDKEETVSVDKYAIAFGAPYEKDGRVNLPLVHTYNRSERTCAIRTVAIDKSGGVHASGRSGSGGNKLDSLTFHFHSLPLEDIKEFQFQIREYEWVTFKNVALRPGGEREGEIEQAAIKAAQKWLALVDGQDYSKSWDEAAEYFKNAVPQDKWVEMVRGVREPLGTLKTRKVKSSQYTTSVPGAPNGEYVIIQFQASFENKESAVETVTPMREKDSTWRVSGYYIK